MLVTISSLSTDSNACKTKVGEEMCQNLDLHATYKDPETGRVEFQRFRMVFFKDGATYLVDFVSV